MQTKYSMPEILKEIESILLNIEKMLKIQPAIISDPILDTGGVMNLLKVSRRSLQNWRDEGIIQFSTINGKIYYKFSAINKMLDEHTQNHKN